MTAGGSMDDGQRVVWPRTHCLTCPGVQYVFLDLHLTIYITKFLKVGLDSDKIGRAHV